MRTAIVGLLLLVASTARADDTVSPDLTPDYYDTELQAATAALQLSYDRSNAYEYGGIILRTTNGKYRFSSPETDYRGDGINIDYTNDFAGYTVVADYHTHPCLPYSHWPNVFSNGDVNSNSKQGLTAYMGDLCSGVVRQFTPGIDKLDICWKPSAIEAAMGINVCGSRGREVGKITLYGPVLQETPGPETRARGMNGW